METLSSNTLFHFTSKPSFLISILQEGFKPRYCMEDFSMFEFILGKDNSNFAVPMVCFCDLPLSKVKDHVGKYGNFGIGLTKEWGMREKVSPLMYVSRKIDGIQGDLNSATTLAISNAMSILKVQREVLIAFGAQMLGNSLFFQHIDSEAKGEKFNTKNLSDEQIEIYNNFLKLDAIRASIDEADGSLLRMIRFTKPHFVDKWRTWTNVKFYDEREWRFVPDINPQKTGLPSWIFKDQYDDEMGRELFNYQLGQQFSLKFKPEDIKYIIVEEESQAPAIIRQVYNIDKDPNEAVKIMSKTRILTKQQIFDDF